MSVESLYIVWCPTGSNPTIRHTDIEAARQEARRLADTNPDHEFILLRGIQSITRVTEPYRVINYCKS